MRAVHCDSFVEEGLGLLDVSYGEHSGDEGFTWFGPLERNTLRPRENVSYIAVCYSNIGLALGALDSV
jgi:hypothetical protein